MITTTNEPAVIEARVQYTVWVGGAEVTDRYLTREEAERVAAAWHDYSDVVIEEQISLFHRVTNPRNNKGEK